jgi:hypothetical protein
MYAHQQLGAVDPAAVIASIPGGQIVVGYLKAEVKNAAKEAVLPYILGTMALAGAAFLLALVAVVRK